MKKKNQILVSLSIVALLGGCSEESVQRDVYQSLDDCLADWKRIELCEADNSKDNAQATNTQPDVPANPTNNAQPNADQALPQNAEGNGTDSQAKAESSDPSLATAIAGGVMGYMAARAISSFLGPSYHPGNRAVTTPSGQVVQPQTNRSVGKPMLVKGNAGSMNSKPVSRGGFSSPSSSNRSSGG